MAEFCHHCSLVEFGKDYRDFAQLLKPEDYGDLNDPENACGALVLCECCGPIVVDINGKRLSTDFYPSCTCEQDLKSGKVKLEDVINDPTAYKFPKDNEAD